jgi:hypothetical protein
VSKTGSDVGLVPGTFGGPCNVRACRKAGATWWNTSTLAYYCGDCAWHINFWSYRDHAKTLCVRHDAKAAGR